jgi:MoxR-like ATPase
MDYQQDDIISNRKREEFHRLFQEFAKRYPQTKEGRDHVKFYDSGRNQARMSYENIVAASNRGEDITDLVLKKLLPHSDNAPNRQEGAWIHVAPSISRDVKAWFENSGWTKPQDWPKVAEAILHFVRRCVEDPNQLERACREFSDLPYSKGFQTGMLTPILNALRPDVFLIINNKSRRLFNYFTESSYSQNLVDYPFINKDGKALIADLSDDMQQSSDLDIPVTDLFDMFSHWMVAVEKYDFDSKSVTYASKDSSRSLVVKEGVSQMIGTSIGMDSVNPECSFTPRTFELLAQIHATPTNSFYQAHKEEFKSHIEEPFKRLMRNVAKRLPSEITDVMETRKQLFSRFPKNDFGQGGAWDHYWGAFYTKGGKKIEDAQLSLWINYDRLEIGFYIGDYGNRARSIFRSNSKKYYSQLFELLEPVIKDESILVGSPENFKILPDEKVKIENRISWEEWLQDPEQGGYDISLIMPRGRVLQLSEEELTQKSAQIFDKLFPLVLLATSSDPLPVITHYMGIEDGEPEPNPSYPLSQCSHDTGIDKEILSRWVRAIERKKQAIFYGPPGTGKTFIAEHLARHLIGGGEGIVDLVQFHPAYAYEDFIQGIRPESNPDRGLEYPVVPGRFLQFCRKAEGREGLCVLIIDEINRANLARVFGELMYLLEYRDKEVPLAGGGRFRIPENVRIIGTMNTADRSIALVDHALRRRFAFLALYPDFEILRHYHQKNGTDFPVEGLIATLEKLNRQIGDPHYEVGITFFLRRDLNDQIEDIWRMEIEPYLEEYFFDQREKVDSFRWDKVASQIRS